MSALALPDDRAGDLVRRTVRLAPEPGAARRARALLREVLVDAGRADCLDAAELACTELVTNVVLHAHTDMDVTVEVGDHVRVEVRDFNPMPPWQRHYDVHATTGRGLALGAAGADAHGISGAGPDGKTVWFTVGSEAVTRSEEELLSAWETADWDVDAWPAAASGSPQARRIRLLQIPPMLWLAARQHHDALLRELAFYRTQHDVDVDIPAADRARATISTAVMAVVEHAQRTGAAHAPLPSGHPSPLPWVPAPFDLDIDVTPQLGPDAAALQDVLDAAERLASEDRLLARPGLPEIVAVRDWACEQIVAQLAGVQPAPWTGADHERFTQEVDQRAARQLETFAASVRASDRRVVAADDANRIVAISAPLAATLGWEVDALVGRRIVALIPPALREAHVAGFTRHLATGQAHVLGVPLTLPVLRADGTEVMCDFRIERTQPVPRRSLYMAWIDPVTDGLHQTEAG